MSKYKICIMILITIALTSCKTEKKEEGRIIYPEGFFLLKKNLHFSDGRSFYCTFESWDHLYKLRGTKDKPKQRIVSYNNPPTGMRFIKKCNSGILTKKFYQ